MFQYPLTDRGGCNWIGLEPPEDELRRAQVDQIYLSMGEFSPAYVQDRLGVPVEYRDGSRTTVQQDISTFLPFIQTKGHKGGIERLA
jgi:hypothetical protein